ncbi:hypothetical protein [Mesorhizobium sp.]|uniref:hypothetical protein n=1 Tax=Mesorhizobium sp. TaxID=1871066 RepID=UPI0025C2C468|nr:hypothetical protein [Mesorhizobium sp.]
MPSDQDWSLVADVFTKIGGTTAEMEAISNANQDFPGLCPAIAKFYEAALLLQGEAGWHIKTALLRAIVEN